MSNVHDETTAEATILVEDHVDKMTATEDVIGLLIHGDRLPDYNTGANSKFFHMSVSTCRTALDPVPAPAPMQSITRADLKPWCWDFGGINLYEVSTGVVNRIGTSTYTILPNPEVVSISTARADRLIEDFIATKSSVVIDWSLDNDKAIPQNSDELRWFDFLGHELTRPAPWPQILKVSHAYAVPSNDISSAVKILALPKLKLPGESSFREPSSFKATSQSDVWQVEYTNTVGVRVVAFVNTIETNPLPGRVLSFKNLRIKANSINICSEDWLSKFKYRLVETFRMGFVLQDWVSENHIDTSLNKCFLACALDQCSWLPQIDWTQPGSAQYILGSFYKDFVTSESFDGTVIDPVVLLTNLQSSSINIADWQTIIEAEYGSSSWNNQLENNLRNVETIKTLLIRQVEFAYKKQSSPLTPAQTSHIKSVLESIDLKLRTGMQLVKKVIGPMFSLSMSTPERDQLIANCGKAMSTYLNARLSIASPTYAPSWTSVGDYFRLLTPAERTAQLPALIQSAMNKFEDTCVHFLFPEPLAVENREIPVPISIQVDEINQDGSRNSFRKSISGYGVLLKQNNGQGAWRCLNMASPKLRGDTDPLALVWLVPSKVLIDDDIRMAFVSYNNNPLAARSLGAALDDAVKGTPILDTDYMSYEQVRPSINPQYSKNTMLKFGGSYEVVPFPITLGGALPDWLVDKSDLTNFHPSVLKNITQATPPAECVKVHQYRREMDLGRPTFVQISPPQELPENVYPIAEELSDISLFSSFHSLSASRTTFKFSNSGSASNAKKIEIPKFRKSTGILTIKIGDFVSKPIDQALEGTLQLSNSSGDIMLNGAALGIFSTPLKLENNFELAFELECNPFSSTRTSEQICFGQPILRVNGQFLQPDSLEQQPMQKVLLSPWDTPSSKNLRRFDFSLQKPTVSIDCWHRWRARDKDLAFEVLPPGGTGEIKADIDSDIKKCLSAHFSTLAKAKDNPETSQYTLSTVDPAASDTFFVELFCVWTPSGILGDAKSGFYNLEKDLCGAPSGKLRDSVTFSCLPGATAGLNLTSGKVEVSVPECEVWILRVSPLYPEKFLDRNSSDPRFSESIIDSRQSTTGTIIDSHQKIFFKGDPFELMLEAAGKFNFGEVDIEKEIGDALSASFKMSNQTLTVNFDRDSIARNGLVSQFAQVEVMSQVWRWDGRIIQEVPISPQEISGDNYELRHRPGDGTIRQKKEAIIDWDEWGFKSRQNSDFNSELVRLPFQNKSTRLFERNLAGSKRALYYRFRFQIYSRYQGLNSELSRQAKFLVGSMLNDWLRVLIPFRFDSSTDILPTPLMNVLVPLTRSRNAAGKAADGLLVLDEELFKVGGLGELIEPTIVETVLNDKEFGPDPLLVGKIKATPSANTANQKNMLGFTLYPDLTYPPIRQSGLLLAAPSGTVATPQGNSMLNDPSWYMAKYAFRRIISQEWAYDLNSANAKRTESKFTDGSWIQFLPSNRLSYGPVRLEWSSGFVTCSVNGNHQFLEWQNHGTGYDSAQSNVLFEHWLIVTAVGCDYKHEAGNEFLIGVYKPLANTAGQYTLIFPKIIDTIPPPTVRCRVLQLQVDKTMVDKVDWANLLTDSNVETSQDCPARVVRISEPIDATSVPTF